MDSDKRNRQKKLKCVMLFFEAHCKRGHHDTSPSGSLTVAGQRTAICRRRNTKALLDAGKEVGLEVNPESRTEAEHKDRE
jgi:hypothetical protein